MYIFTYQLKPDAQAERGGYQFEALRNRFPDTGREHYDELGCVTPRARPLGPALEHAQNAVLTDSPTSVGTVYVIGANAWYDDGETFVEWPEFLGFEAPEGDRTRVDGHCFDEVPMKPRHKLSCGMLLEVMRGCAAENPACEGCPLDGMMMPHCHDWLVTAAADLIEAQGKRIRELEERLRWIPVTERMPEKDGRYHCIVKSFAFPGQAYQALLFCDRHGFREGNIYTDDVTHWKPMPEEPEVGHD